MPKKIVQDVISSKKTTPSVESSGPRNDFLSKLESDTPRSKKKAVPLQKEPIVNESTEEESLPEKKITYKDVLAEIESKNHTDSMGADDFSSYGTEKPPKISKKVRYIASALFALVVLFGISALFKSAEVKITPRQETKVLDETFTAQKDSSTNSLVFQVVTITKTIEKSIPATDEQKVEKKAQGRIVIYNKTAAIQKLVATTRFETDGGLVYRITKPVAVPARQVKSGEVTPGSIEVVVEADKAGAMYNVELKDFTLPGLKGDSKYSLIYARSKTNMTGGFSGMQKVVSNETLASVDANMETELKALLATDATSQIPSDFVLYKDSLSYQIDAVSQVNPADGSNTASTDALLRKSGTASVIIFDKGTLSRNILAKLMPGQANEGIIISNLDTLSFTLKSPTSIDPNTTKTVTFALKGDAKLVWTFDENKLKTDLLGLSKDSARVVIATYPDIREAQITTRPFWNSTIPKNAKKVTLVNTSVK